MNTSGIRLAFTISSLGFGGAERDLSKCANFWVSEGAEVRIFVFTTSKQPPVYPIDPRVQVYFLKDHFRYIPVARLPDVPRRFLCTIALRQAIKRFRPNVLVAYVDIVNITALLASRGLGIPVIVAERTDPKVCNIPRPFKKIRLLVYPWAHKVVTQTQAAARYFPEAIRKKIVVIPNAVVKQTSSCQIRHSVRRIVSLGRLDNQKGFDILLEAFSLLQDKHHDIRLCIYGEGPWRAHLEGIVRAKKLSSLVSLPGTTSDVPGVLLQADLFIFPSYREGFPNALCEAMALGLPVVASNCSGNAEVVRDGVDGLLVPVGDVQALADAMDRLMNNFEERQRFAKNASTLPERFQEELNQRLWKEVVMEALSAST